MLEKEFTYYTDNTKDMFEFLQIMARHFSEKSVRIKYSDRVELRYLDDGVDKAKVIFKVNHGHIYYSLNTKVRLGDRFDRIQTYDEKRTEWLPLSEFDLDLLNKKIIAFYYKERFKAKIKINNEKVSIIGQSIDFLNTEFENIDKRQYIEVEGTGVSDDLDEKVGTFLYEEGFKVLDVDNSKIWLGDRALSGSQIKFDKIEDLQKMIWEIFKKKYVEKFK